MGLHEIPSRGEGGAWHVVVESPRGATAKLKWEPSLGAMALGRPLPLGVRFPYDWGFIPSTRAPDDDPLDALVVWSETSWPGVVLPCRLIGVARVEQKRKRAGGRERNDRVLAVPLAAARDRHLVEAAQLGARALDELEQFFLAAAHFQDKELRLLGWGDAAEAEALAEKSRV